MKKIVFIWVILLILFLSGCSSNNITGNAIGGKETAKEFNIDAFQFGYSPDAITVNKGDKVKININNVDVPHGIRIPDLGLKGEKTIEFTADKTGEFIWYCLIPCGQGHMQMKGKLIIK